MAIANSQRTKERFGPFHPQFGGSLVRAFAVRPNLVTKAEGVDVRVVGERPLAGVGRLRDVMIIESLDQLMAPRFAQLGESLSPRRGKCADQPSSQCKSPGWRGRRRGEAGPVEALRVDRPVTRPGP